MMATRRAVNRPACAPRRYSTATRSAYWDDWLLYRNRQSAGPSSSHLTHRWREMDSNPRSPVDPMLDSAGVPCPDKFVGLTRRAGRAARRNRRPLRRGDWTTPIIGLARPSGCRPEAGAAAPIPDG